jgi:hypothetical protein
VRRRRQRETQATDAQRYLGVWIVDGQAEASDDQQVTIATPSLGNKEASLDAVWLALRAMLYPRVAYHAKSVPSKDAGADCQLAATTRRAARAVRALPAALMWGPADSMC